MTTLALRHLTAALLVAACLAAAPAAAIDSSGGTSASPPATTHSTATKSLAQARAAISAKNWTLAIADLKQIVKAQPSADAFNLLGYSYRNAGQYDLAGRAYAKALKLDPKHTGALEYQGVLFLKLGQADKAKANLAKIKSICGTSCEAYRDLAKALG